MIRLAFGLAAAALLTSPVAAQAQFNRNHIVNSGNGTGNTIVARNHSGPVFVPVGGGFVPVGGGGVHSNRVVNSGNGVGNTILTSNGGRFGVPGGFPGGGFVTPGGFPGGGFGGGFPGGGFGGVNVNVVTNSGNGIGNTILTGNRPTGPGGININVITNSGNGAGNTIGTFNK
jgi:hypothetical protein